jgi:hypothetical protein
MQDAIKKALAEFLVRRLDPGNFDDVYADSENHEYFLTPIH